MYQFSMKFPQNNKMIILVFEHVVMVFLYLVGWFFSVACSQMQYKVCLTYVEISQLHNIKNANIQPPIFSEYNL